MGLPDSLDVQNTLSLKGGTWEERDPRSQRSVEMNRLPSPTASPKKNGKLDFLWSLPQSPWLPRTAVYKQRPDAHS